MKKIFKLFWGLIIFISLFSGVFAAAPTITDFSGSVDENSDAGTSVLTHTGSDEDGDTITYSIIDGNTNNAFSIDADTAEITVSGSLDYEDINQYELIVQVEDPDGNTGTGKITIDINDLDEIAPEFDKIDFVSNNDNTSYAKEGDDITITFYIDPADTWKSGNNIDFKIGDGDEKNSGNFTKSEDEAITNRNKTYTVEAGDNGEIKVTNITFYDAADNELTGATLPYTPEINVIVDTILPTISFENDVEEGPVQSDTINIKVDDENIDTGSLEYGFSDDDICDENDTYGNSFTSEEDFVIDTEDNNGKYICVIAKDKAGNISYKVSANVLNIDATKPVKPTQADLQDSSDSGELNSDNITNDSTPIFNLECSETGTTLKLYINDEENNTYDCSSIGTVELTVSGSLDDGDYIVYYTEIDEAGNESEHSDDLNITIDTTKPTIVNLHIESNNSNSGSWAKSGDKIILIVEFSEEVVDPEIMILNNTGAVNITKSGSSNIYIAEYTTINSDEEGIVKFTVNTNDIAGNILDEVEETTDDSQVIFDRTVPNFSMNLWDRKNTIDMRYQIWEKISDPGAGNESDNLEASGSLTGKEIVIQDNRPSPGANITGFYTIVYSLSDVAGNKKVLVRNVFIYGASGTSSNSKKMDVCNETNGDHSGDYYDGKCTKDIDKSDKKDDNDKYDINKKEKDDNLTESKITIKKDIIKYTNNDIEKYKAKKENVIKYKDLIEKKYSKKISKISKSNYNKVISRIDNVLNNIGKYKFSESKKQLIIELLIALKEIFLSK